MTPTMLAAAGLHLARTRTASPHTASAARVATQWLHREASIGYDHIARCMVLEGVAGVRPLTWANNNAARNLGKAKEMLLAEHPNMDPKWFQRQDTGLWGAISNRVQGLFRANGISGDDGLDVLHAVLYGLSKDNKQMAMPLQRVGQTLKEAILNGKETPAVVGAGLAGKWFSLRAISEIKTLRRRNAPGEVETMEDLSTSPGSGDFAKVFMDIITDPANRVGQVLRTAILDAFTGSAAEEVGKAFYSHLFATGDVPKKRDIARTTGKSEQLVAHQMSILGNLVVRRLTNNRALLRLVEDEVRSHGAEFPDSDVFVKMLMGGAL